MTEEKLPAVSYQIPRPDLTQLTGTMLNSINDWGVSKLDLSGLTNFCPDEELIYRALEIVTPEAARVIILGQDPYPQKGVGTGLKNFRKKNR